MNHPQATPWHILGCGAIGGLWACHLACAGARVMPILRDEASARRYPGVLTLSEPHGEEAFPLPAAAPTEAGPVHRVLVATKSYATLEALRAVAGRLTDDAVIVLLHNGLGPQQQVAEMFPRARVYAGTTTEGAYREGPWRLVHAGRGESFFGPLNPAARTAGSAPLAPLLELALAGHYDKAILTRLWQKLAINGAINGLTAVHDCRNGELAENPALRDEMAALCRETELLAERLGQPLFTVPLLEQALAVARATAANYSSMLQDVRQGRPTEIAFINGYLCREAERIGLPLPHHRRLLAAVTEQESNP